MDDLQGTANSVRLRPETRTENAIVRHVSEHQPGGKRYVVHARPSSSIAPRPGFASDAIFLGHLPPVLPAWLVSLVFHMVAILLLGIWTLAPALDKTSIHLSTAVGYQDLPGDEALVDDLPDEAFEFDDAGATTRDESTSDAIAVGNDAFSTEDLKVDLPDPLRSLPEMPPSIASVGAVSRSGRMYDGRDPTLRAGRLEREGGTSFTEAAVARGLRWIARHQNPDGSWSLHAFHQSPDCRGKCGGAGGTRSDVAGTALALLPMLGAGQTHQSGDYTKEVEAGLYWLTRQQDANGDLRGRESGRSMYAHGLAAIVLCEAFGMTGDASLREPAQKAIRFIAAAQHSAGGWRYEPGQPGDTSVAGWQLMALRSGQMAYLNVPARVFARADSYLNDAQADSYGGRYGYMPGSGPSVTMTAEALLCRQYMGWPKDHPGLMSGTQYLLENLPDPSNPNVYYWYYATQVLYHLGGKPWERWNARMRVVLPQTQEMRGHQAGSWSPRGEFASQGGRLYMTSLAVCTLEVYYRHLPLYRSGALEDHGAATGETTR